MIAIEPIFLKYQPNKGIFNSSFFKIKIGPSSGICNAKVSNIDWWAEATKKLSTFFKFSSPWKITLVFITSFKIKTMYYADNLPKKTVNFSGKIKVGIANMKITKSPV